MLSSLSIQNVVLIDRLMLEGDAGLCALTGETGAGKSILLDALGLALGAKADAGLVRHGEAQATVTACFDLPPGHPAQNVLKEQGLETDAALILRRTLSKDGKSKAFINDAPVSVQLLKTVGALLIEVHGQFETRGLIDPATHRAALDTYAGLDGNVAALRKLWQEWQAARTTLEQALADLDSSKLQEEYLRYAVAELEKLAPQAGEEKALADKRVYLLNFEKLREGFEQAAEILDSDDGLQNLLGRLENTLARLSAKAGEALAPTLEGLARAKGEMAEVAYQIERLKNNDLAGGESLEDVEERYFALKDCAKKHRATVDDLPRVFEELSQKLRLITHQDDALSDLRRTAETARRKYTAGAEKISQTRRKTAQKLAAAVQKELPDLKLDKAKFQVDCAVVEEEGWGAEGIDKVQFLVATNPQTPAGPLHKIASGGEMARFMLALKVVLAETGSIGTLIFDEVDSGIGGATADAVGERLARLARKYQVLVVTHSPQVAARARHHWHVAKTEQKGTVITRITPLSTLKDRQEEIARMLSGATVTKEARAQAVRLLENHDAAA